MFLGFGVRLVNAEEQESQVQQMMSEEDLTNSPSRQVRNQGGTFKEPVERWRVSEVRRRQSWQIVIKSMCVTEDVSHIWQLDNVNLICGELVGFRRGKHSAALLHNPSQDVSMAVHGNDCLG